MKNWIEFYEIIISNKIYAFTAIFIIPGVISSIILSIEEIKLKTRKFDIYDRSAAMEIQPYEAEALNREI